MIETFKIIDMVLNLVLVVFILLIPYFVLISEPGFKSTFRNHIKAGVIVLIFWALVMSLISFGVRVSEYKLNLMIG